MEGLLSNPSLGLVCSRLQGSVRYRVQRVCPLKLCDAVVLPFFTYVLISLCPSLPHVTLNPFQIGPNELKCRSKNMGQEEATGHAVIADSGLLSCERMHFCCLKPPS